MCLYKIPNSFIVQEQPKFKRDKIVATDSVCVLTEVWQYYH